MKILFIGSLYPDQSFKQLINEKVDVGFAAQVFQTALIKGIDSFADVQVLSEVTVPSYPKYNKIWVKQDKFSHKQDDKCNDMTVSFLNLPIIKQFSIFLSYIRNLKNTKTSDVVLIYEITSRHLLSAIIGCRGIKKVLIVPDLPEYMSDNKNLIYLFLKKIDGWIINRLIRYIDGFVLFSDLMRQKLNIVEKPYIVIEGIYNPQPINDVPVKVGKKIVLYTGKIEQRFGLLDLLNAFTKIDGNDYELWLCGSGEIAMVKEFADNDKRIKYLGIMPHHDILILQRQATILVNPRHSTDEYTMYSFPSKTLEYMASGIPTLMCKLKSIPKEYYDHLYFFDDESIEGMAKTMKSCLDKPEIELYNKGKNASKFIYDHKTSCMQGKKVYEFLNLLQDNAG